MSLRVIDIEEAVEPLADYIDQADEGLVVVTEAGRPVAVVMAVENVDLETISLSTNPEFIAIIEQSRDRAKAEGTVSLDEVKRRLGLTKMDEADATEPGSD